MYDWLIVGGGVHGTFVSNVLVQGSGVPREKVCVLDPYEEVMHRWRHCAHSTGMEYLRSPAVHHLALDPVDLLRFARSPEGRACGSLHPPYDRPGAELFDAHCRQVVSKGGLDRLRVAGKATHLARGRGGWEVETDRGLLKAYHVVLAMGAGDKPQWPVWASELKAKGYPVDHVFDERFGSTGALCEDGEVVAVVGGGISALQVAMRVASSGKANVTVVTRSKSRVHQFDSDPCWLGPKCLRDYGKTSDLEERRRIISKARNKGSVPAELARAWKRTLKHGQGVELLGEVQGHRVCSEGGVELLGVEGDILLRADRVILATGFGCVQPRETWLAESVESLGLVCSACGYPVVNEFLQWDKNLFVSGPLAELELGPASRNIWGARMTGGRIHQYLRGAA